jgi:hypothetical protein
MIELAGKKIATTLAEIVDPSHLLCRSRCYALGRDR